MGHVPSGSGRFLTDAGTAWVVRGTTHGLTPRGIASYSQSTHSVPGDNENGDRIGGVLRLIDANKDGKAELIASAPARTPTTAPPGCSPARATVPPEADPGPSAAAP
ncbi:hypothetical protein ABTY98_19810 [Streptomyces sp. NPDC096040]|uniref:hypothetical protein n=1 Tax=Streptomyces sp. NPDC096040 TaxID=3155541 RepID=UPI003319FAED